MPLQEGKSTEPWSIYVAGWEAVTLRKKWVDRLCCAQGEEAIHRM